jgi:hypothetical protein
MSTQILLNKLEKKSSKVLFVWQGTQVPVDLQSQVELIQEYFGGENKLCVEHVDRLSNANYSQSTFDLIISNLLTPEMKASDAQLLNDYLRMLKPNGKFFEFVKSTNSLAANELETELKLNGFKNTKIEKHEENLMIYAEKPNFEVGASSKLKFAYSKPTIDADRNDKKVWKFSANDLNEEDLIDTDDLLDDLDLKKPAPVEKAFDCGTSNEGKKKACKNCSCGLAEELEKEASDNQKKNTVPAVKSSCGSCYLGDAFRCASCPYLGLPAFKAGEKIQIGESLLKSDI